MATILAYAPLNVRGNTIRAEDLSYVGYVHCPANSPIPGAIKFIKQLVNVSKLWLDQPVMRQIANTNYEIQRTAETYSSGDDWQVTLGDVVLISKKDGEVRVNQSHSIYRTSSAFSWCVML